MEVISVERIKTESNKKLGRQLLKPTSTEVKEEELINVELNSITSETFLFLLNPTKFLHFTAKTKVKCATCNNRHQ